MGSGNFVGHALPAVFFCGFGCFFLLLTLKRCRDLQDKSRKNGGEEHFSLSSSFAARHLPEQNPTVLRGAGIVLLICTTFGGIFEAVGGYKDGLGFFHQLAHQTLYLSVFFTGAVCCLEANKLLFPNSHRYSLTFTFLLQYILWNEHAVMKEDMSDMRVHLLQAHLNFVAFVTFGYSAYNTKSLFAYVSGWAVMTLNGMWMFTAGLTTCCVDILAHTVGAVLVLEVLFIAALIVLCMVCLLDPPSYINSHTNADEMKYSSVNRGDNDSNIETTVL